MCGTTLIKLILEFYGIKLMLCIVERCYLRFSINHRLLEKGRFLGIALVESR
jgi:hypothetical protein